MGPFLGAIGSWSVQKQSHWKSPIFQMSKDLTNNPILTSEGLDRNVSFVPVDWTALST
jgi:hypothetical protein